LYVWDGTDTNITLTYPGAKGCLQNLSQLYCDSGSNSEYLNQLSQICHNLLLLNITFCEDVVSSGLEDLIVAQKTLKHLYIKIYTNLSIINPLRKLPNTIIKLIIRGKSYTMP